MSERLKCVDNLQEIKAFAINRLTEILGVQLDLLDSVDFFHSNCCVFMLQELVFRMGQTIRLNPNLEQRLWKIGHSCGACTPKLIESGLFEDNPYMIYRQAPGNQAPNAAWPTLVGEFLRNLHESDISAFPHQGNWPARRNRRYEVATDFALRIFGKRHLVFELISNARIDFNRQGVVPNHGDFRSANVLIADNDTIAIGVIDWTDAHRGSREEDIGGCDPENIEQLLKGYQSTNTVDLDVPLIIGHSLARILSLIEFGVLSLDSFETAYEHLKQLKSRKV